MNTVPAQRDYYIIDEDPFKVHIERSSSFRVHNPSHCPRRHSVQVLYNAQTSIYVLTNSTSSHKAMKTQDKMSENLHDPITPNIWPSSFSSNPLDYYVWGVVEWETNKHPHNTLDSFRAPITRVMTQFDSGMQTFRQRNESVVAAEGDFVE